MNAKARGRHRRPAGIGAYPPGQYKHGIRRGDPDELPKRIRNIESVALPDAVPFEGSAGALLEA
ncbi:MAG: hypothetical protein ACLPTJ_20325 [Solirubrobacteraceae bacterium]